MKQLLLATLCCAALAAPALLPAQSGAGEATAAAGAFLNTTAYAAYFGFQDGKVKFNSRYITSAPIEDREKFGALGSRLAVDTPLEFALLSYYAPITIEDASVRVQAEAVLPKDKPRQAGLQLGAAVYKELTELRFLDPQNTAAVGRYEDMLRFITERNGVTRAEIETFYRNGIGGLIAETVGEGFNRVSTGVLGTNGGGCNGRLIRKSGQFVLECEGYWGIAGEPYTKNGTVTESSKEFSGTSLDTLIIAMRQSGFFSATAYDQVRAQAALIPAVIYGNWKPRGVDALALIAETLTNFYLANPNQQTAYASLQGIYARYETLTGNFQDTLAYKATNSYLLAVRDLSPVLFNKLKADVTSITYMQLAKLPNDTRFEIFSTPYSSNR